MATHSSILDWKKPMDRGGWWATVHGVTKSQSQLRAHTCTWLNTCVNWAGPQCPDVWSNIILDVSVWAFGSEITLKSVYSE